MERPPPGAEYPCESPPPKTHGSTGEAFAQKSEEGVPASGPWVKNPPAVAPVTAEAQSQSPAQELPYATGGAFKKT